MEDDHLFPEEITDVPLDFYVMPIGDDCIKEALSLSMYLRLQGYSTDVCLEHKGVGAMFKKAERREALYAILIGEDEVKNKQVQLKNLVSQEQITVKNDELLEKIDELFGEDEEEHHHHE